MSKALDVQVGGDHYKKYAIQPIEYCHHNKLPPCESAIVQYITRWKDKGGLQDLLKVKHYIDLLIELEGLDRVAEQPATLKEAIQLAEKRIAQEQLDRYEDKQ